MTRLIESLSEIAEGYDALYCDLWGCYHDGLRPYPEAVAALRAFRAGGGRVVLMTNAPRPADAVAAHLAGMGAPEDTHDAIVSSGDAARHLVASGRLGRRVEHVGPARDLPFFEGLDVERVSRDEAESVIVTGLYDDETETPEDYADAVADWRARGLTALCANPDIVVDRGDRRIYCAGAIAEVYAAAGGEVLVSGKPHPPIYALAADLLRGLGVEGVRVLALGDGMATDIAGGAAQGLDTLLVTGGLLARRFGPDPERPDPALLAEWAAAEPTPPTYAIGRLR